MGNTPRRVRIVRDARRINVPNLGYCLAVPPVSFPDTPIPDAPQERSAALGWERPPIPEGAVDELDVSALAAPGAWERCWVSWLSDQLGVHMSWDATPNPETAARSTFGADVQRRLVTATPWSSASEIPDGVLVRRADSHRVEAREAAFEIRQWLERNGGLEASDRVLVLLPRDRLLAEVWQRELEAAGVPAKGSTARPLAETGFARWVVLLARLSGWSDRSTRPLSLLREVVEAPFWSKSRCGLAFTARIRREAFLSVRRPEVTLDLWGAHLEALAKNRTKEKEDDETETLGEERSESLRNLGAFSRDLAVALNAGPSLIARFRDLLFDTADGKAALQLAVRHVAAKRYADVGDNDLEPSMDRISGILEKLAAQEAAAGGVHERIAADESLPNLLEQEIGEAYLYHRFEPEQGVTVTACELYDGRTSDLLVLGGLGENGFPSVPSPPTHQEAQWMEGLQLISPEIRGEPATRWIVSELERQIDIARTAIAQCRERLVLSFSTQGSGTEVVHPGGFLSLLVGGWREEIWVKGGARLRDCRAADEIPMQPSEARGAREATSFAVSDAVRSRLQDLVARDDTGRLSARLTAVERLSHSLDVDRERMPAIDPSAGDELHRTTAHTGHLPGAVSVPEAYSASALTTYGECPARYFLSRVLRLEEPAQASPTPAPHEMGTLLHTAFDRATRAVIAGGASWKLTHPDTVGAKEALVQDVLGKISAELYRLTDAFSSREPTASSEYLTRLSRSWRRAIENWLSEHVALFSPAETIAIDEAPAVAELLEEHRRQSAALAACLDSLAQFETAFPLFEKKQQTKTHWESHANALGVTKKALGEACSAWKASGEVAEVSGILRAAQAKKALKTEESRIELEAAREEETERRASRFNRHVVLSEQPFGGIAGTEPLALSVGDGRDVRLHGVVDRIDLDPERAAYAIRDYKSGRGHSGADLVRNLVEGSGYFFQILLYLYAIEKLASEGKIETLRHAEAHHVALEFLRTAEARELLKPHEPSPFGIDDAALSWTDLTRLWISHHTAGIESGRFDHLPTRCPKDDPKSRCDFQRICPYREGARELFVDELRPRIELIQAGEAKATAKRKTKYAEMLPLSRGVTSGTVEERRAEHEHGQRLAVAIDRDVLLSAGAGTGKTYNLVRRYLAAIAAGCRPGEVVCATFTRRAAAEMKHRVRQALLSADDGAAPALAGLKSDPRRFRDLVLSLSGAPFLTIDSLAGRVLGELLEIESPNAVRCFEEIDEDAARSEVREFVAQRVIEDLGRDRDLDVLADRIYVGRLPDVLFDLLMAPQPDWVKSATDVEALTAKIRADWQEGLSDIESRVAAVFRAFPIDEIEAQLEQARADGEVNEDTAKCVRGALGAMRALARSGAHADTDVWRTARAVDEVEVFRKTDGDRLYDAWNPVSRWRDLVAEKNTAPRTLLDAWAKIADFDADPARWAETTARALFVTRSWREAIEERLENANKLRFRDVEARALSRLEALDEAGAAAFRERFPMKHLFVDESQDTSGAQVRLIRRLAEVCGARLFWVGDIKQSIYRFRNAEVDVFEGLVADMPHDGRGSLRENWRSDPRLIEAFNQLFGAMLPARSDGIGAVDPGSSMDYDALTWPRHRSADQKDPAIELFAGPGRGYEERETGDLVLDDDDDAAESDSDKNETSAELSLPTTRLFGRLAAIVDDAARRGTWKPGDPPYVAVLASTWDRATRYNEALRRHGIKATVQGGRGLLSTPEVASLIWWLELAAERSETAVAGILRGPGLAMSDAGLACLGLGYGDGDAHTRKRLVNAAVNGKLDPDAAIQEWRAEAPGLDTVGLKKLLEADAEALAIFQRTWERTFRVAGTRSTADLFEQLIEELGLDAYWRCAVDGGRQAMANLSRFVEHIRALEVGRGLTPLELLTRLRAAVGDDGLPSGGIEAGVDAEVVITTYWQAKGLEWPIVALPDLEKTETKTLCPGVLPERMLVPTDGEGSARTVKHIAGCHETPSGDPFRVSAVKPLETLRNLWRGPAERAELRRLFYVALTRAKHRVLLSGTFDKIANAKAAHKIDDDGKDRCFGLDQAENWARTLAVCLDLKREDDALVVGPGSALEGPTICIETVSVPPLSRGGRAGVATRADGEIEVNPAWVPLASPIVTWTRPSDLVADELPIPMAEIVWPEALAHHDSPFGSPAQEGTAFHEMMQRWAFGGRNGHALTKEMAVRATDKVMGAAAAASIERAADRLVSLFGIVRGKNEGLVLELERAAREGRLYTELPLRFRNTEGRWLDGIIDLAWHDDAGWHVLDYKTGDAHFTATTWASDETLSGYYAQVRSYARGLETLLPGTRVVDFGLWYVASGLVVRWRAEET